MQLFAAMPASKLQRDLAAGLYPASSFQILGPSWAFEDGGLGVLIALGSSRICTSWNSS